MPYISAKSYKRQSVVPKVAIHEKILTAVTHMYPGVPPFETWTEDKLYGARRGESSLPPGKQRKKASPHMLIVSLSHSQLPVLVPTTIHTAQCCNLAVTI